MPFNPIAGKQGSVTIGATAYAFGKWKITMKSGMPKVTNFTGQGFRQLVAGIFEATVTLDGPWDVGNMPFTLGQAITLILGVTSVVSLTVPVLIESIEPNDDVEDAAKVTVVAQQSGSFAASIT